MAYPETSTEAARNPHASQIVKRLHAIREHAECIRASAGATADKIVGPEPPQAVGPGNVLKEVAPSGFFGEVNEVLASIERTLSLTGDSLRRFEREF